MSGTDPDLAECAARAGLRLPTALTIAITGRCNLRCRHCWVEAGMPTSAGHVAIAGVFRLVDGFAVLGGDTIWITGGEPLTHPAWPAILSHCCAQASVRTVGLQTNGGLLDDACVARLRALPTAKLAIMGPEAAINGRAERVQLISVADDPSTAGTNGRRAGLCVTIRRAS